MALTVIITSADGAQYRLGPDESDAAWVPENITWESTVPGGWKSGGFNLRRRIDEDVPLRLLDEVEIIDEHGATMYEGRIQKTPRQHADNEYLYVVECLGWAAHLLDDTSFREVYIDRDLARWGEPSLQRKANLAAAAWDFTSVQTGPAADITNGPGFSSLVTGPMNKPFGEVWYDAGAGLAIKEVQIARSVNSGFAAVDTEEMYIANSANDQASPDGEVSADLADIDPSGKSFIVPARYTRIEWKWNASGGVAPTQYGFFWHNIRVHGNHGVAYVGVFPDEGYYIDDILANALSRAAPKLNYSTGAGGSIERPPLVVSQAAYHEPGPVENVILDLNKYVLWDWLVYEDRTFFYRPTDPDRLTWEARLDRGIHLSLEGDDAEHAYNGAMVKYGLPDGTRKVAGPTGSGFDVTSDLLADTSAENTVNQHGYPRRWIELDISFPLALDVYATTIGAAYLAQASLPARSGDITLRGEVEHPTKGMRPVREVRAGDWIRLSDHPADVPRRIISSRHTNDGRETVVTVGNDMNKVDAILEQLGVATKVRLG